MPTNTYTIRVETDDPFGDLKHARWWHAAQQEERAIVGRITTALAGEGTKLARLTTVLETLHDLFDRGATLAAETTPVELHGYTVMAYIYDALTFEPEH